MLTLPLNCLRELPELVYVISVVRAVGGGREVGDAEVLCEQEESVVRSPELDAADKGGRQKVNVDPAGAAAVQTVGANQFNDFFVSDDGHMVEAPVIGKEAASATAVTYQ